MLTQHGIDQIKSKILKEELLKEANGELHQAKTQLQKAIEHAPSQYKIFLKNAREHIDTAEQLFDESSKM